MRKPNRKSLPDHILGLELSKPFTSTPEITADLVIKILAHDSTLWLNNQGTGYRPQVARSLALWQIATQQNPDQLITWAETQKPAAITQTIEKVKTILTLKPSRKFIFTSHVRGHLTNSGIPLTKNNNTYSNKLTHRGYSKPELTQLLGKLPNDLHKFYLTVAAETGIRARTLLKITINQIKTTMPELPNYDSNYPHIQFQPADYKGKKMVGYCFLSPKTIQMLKTLQDKKIIGTQPTDKLFPKAYISLFQAIHRAKKAADLDQTISTIHGFRYTYGYSLDAVQPRINDPISKRLKGRANGSESTYTTRDIPELQKEFIRAYPWIDISSTQQELTTKQTDLEAKLDILDKKYKILLEAVREAIPNIQTDLEKSREAMTHWKQLDEEHYKQDKAFLARTMQSVTNIPKMFNASFTDEFTQLPLETRFRLIRGEPTEEDQTLLNNLMQKKLQNLATQASKTNTTTTTP